SGRLLGAADGRLGSGEKPGNVFAVLEEGQQGQGDDGQRQQWRTEEIGEDRRRGGGGERRKGRNPAGKGDDQPDGAEDEANWPGQSQERTDHDSDALAAFKTQPDR